MKNIFIFKVKLLNCGGELEQRQETAFPKESLDATNKNSLLGYIYIFLAHLLLIVPHSIRSLSIRISSVHLFFSCFISCRKITPI